MNRLSADRMYLAKWVLPAVVFVSVSVYMLWKERGKAKPGYLILSAALAVMAVVFVVMFKRRMWNLADDVLDGGTYLLVRFGAREASINLSDITNVEAENRLGATTVRLRLALVLRVWHRGIVPRESTSCNPFAVNRIAEDLIGRVGGRSNNRWKGCDAPAGLAPRALRNCAPSAPRGWRFCAAPQLHR